MKVTERTLGSKAEPCNFFFFQFIRSVKFCVLDVVVPVLRLGYYCFRFYGHVLCYPKL